jgi:hypothetical protein
VENGQATLNDYVARLVRGEVDPPPIAQTLGF